MKSVQAVEVRTEFVNFWNEVLVPKFVQYRHILVGGLANHSAKVFPSLDVREGDRVVDIACGFGDTAIELAKRVGETGSVLGIDCCEGFMKFGREDIVVQGITNVTFVEGDVEMYPFEPVYDFCFSRFGTQFFENPVAGLRNMRTALKPGGKLACIVWREIEDNPWLGLAKKSVLKFLPPTSDDGLSCGPGPFSMANTEMVTKQFEIAGYTDIEFERIDANILVGNSLEEAVAFQVALGPAGEVFREAGELALQKKAEIEAQLKIELAPYLKPEGVMLDSSSWIIRARNPE